MPRLFPKLTASGLQVTTYLLGIALFSISFLVFLNSSIGFVITEIIGRTKKDGDAVGTLGFADELLALVACPLWGLLSDRVGVRPVAVVGYCIIGVSMIGLVQSTNVYPELLLGRLVFSLGAAACSTMVTAVLPAMIADPTAEGSRHDEEHATRVNGHAARLRAEERHGRSGSIDHGPSPSVNSELTITPRRYASKSKHGPESQTGENEEADSLDKTAGTSQLAGLTGFFTGAGALLALAVFLPLPAYFQDKGNSQAKSLQITYYIVAALAFCIAVFVFFGLRNLPGEEKKNWSALFRPPYDEDTRIDHEGILHTTLSPAPSFFFLAKESIKLGFTDPAIGLGYLGGFVARASSVAISLWIPFFVNAYFVDRGLCKHNPHNLPDIKEKCKQAYQLAAALSGICETAALLCAPLFGWAGGRAAKGRPEWPLLLAAIVGVGGYVSFGLLKNPDPFSRGGDRWAILSVIFIGISQIGAIVCSLGLLGRGIHESVVAPAVNEDNPSTMPPDTLVQNEVGPVPGEEAAPLLPAAHPKHMEPRFDRSRLKGSIAGMYSLAGGAGILLLTKLGGVLFDSWTTGAPFYLMAIFNAVLLVAIVLIGGGSALWRRHKVDHLRHEREE